MKYGAQEMAEHVCKKQTKRHRNLKKKSYSSPSCGDRIKRALDLNWDDKLK